MNPFLKLINQTLQDWQKTEDEMLILAFEDYQLAIYNRYSPNTAIELNDLRNKKIIDINIVEDNFFELLFDGKLSIIVFIDESSYKSPEAMQLSGSNNLIAVWT
jgi:hypothetical protein